MKYLPLRDLETVTSALNFTTADCHVTGGCDLYTTKAAGSDKKLYKDIEQTLESQHESLLRLSESLSPPQVKTFAESYNLSGASPFGPLSQVSSRRTFAYLIATLNASHPDYDFSQVLRPSDFRRERNLKVVMGAVDDTIYHLRPSRPQAAYLATPTSTNGQGNGTSAGASGAQTPGGTVVWGPRMWRLIDKEMSLRTCSIYCLAPDDDPFEDNGGGDGGGDESGAIWSLHYLFFNKERKRVCYLHLRGRSIVSHSPVLRGLRTPIATPSRAAGSGASGRRRSSTYHKRHGSTSLDGIRYGSDSGATKRARYWLGDRTGTHVEGADWGDGDGELNDDVDLDVQDLYDDDDDVIHDPGDDEVDAEDWLGPRSPPLAPFIPMGSIPDSDDDEVERVFRERSTVRGMSESVMDSVEV